MKRDSMIFYASFHQAAKALEKDSEKAALYDAIFEYALFGKEFELTGTPRAMFLLIKPQLEANIRKYRNGKRPKQKQNVSKPEAPIKQTGSKTEGNVNVNVNDNDNDNVNVNENVNVNKGRFTPPTPTQVSNYAKEQNKSIDGERFCDFYESKGWMVGKNKMKSWQAAVRNWLKDKDSPNGQQNISLKIGKHPDLI